MDERFDALSVDACHAKVWRRRRRVDLGDFRSVAISAVLPPPISAGNGSFVFGYDTDRTIVLKQRGSHLFNAGASGFAQGSHYLMTGELGMLQSLLEKLAIADEHVRPSFDQSFQLFASISEEPNDPVDPDQGHCGNHPSDDGVVATVHGILNGIAQDQEQNQIEWRQLADLPLPG